MLRKVTLLVVMMCFIEQGFCQMGPDQYERGKSKNAFCRGLICDERKLHCYIMADNDFRICDMSCTVSDLRCMLNHLDAGQPKKITSCSEPLRSCREECWNSQIKNKNKCMVKDSECRSNGYK